MERRMKKIQTRKESKSGRETKIECKREKDRREA